MEVNDMKVKEIRAAVLEIIKKYPISRVILFGSQAAGTANAFSDVDLIFEFRQPISLITLGKIKVELEDKLKLPVDIIHGPITDSDMIEVDHQVVLYAA